MALPASSIKSKALQTASRALRRGEATAARLRARIDPIRPAVDGQARPGMNPDVDGRYGRLWNPIDVKEAIAEIYNTTDMAAFEEGGQLDAGWVNQFVSESSTVLDLGCGIGRVARYVAPNCKEMWAADASERMLQIAAQRLSDFPNVRLLHSGDTKIPAPDDSVDVAYSLLVLQHVEREDAFLLLEELRRILKPDGRALLTFPNLLSDTYLDSFLMYAHTGGSTQPNRARIYTPEEVDRLMTAAGFTCELEPQTEIRVIATPKG